MQGLVQVKFARFLKDRPPPFGGRFVLALTRPIWWDSVDNPRGSGWAKIAVGLPDYVTAQTALANARAEGTCRS